MTREEILKQYTDLSDEQIDKLLSARHQCRECDGSGIARKERYSVIVDGKPTFDCSFCNGTGQDPNRPVFAVLTEEQETPKLKEVLGEASTPEKCAYLQGCIDTIERMTTRKPDGTVWAKIIGG